MHGMDAADWALALDAAIAPPFPTPATDSAPAAPRRSLQPRGREAGTDSKMGADAGR
jgi:hypothetical protein